ncbi:MAG: DUF3159 domain-containing protein [Demequinaceae bacterium]|nr:DUF3159 domain-containing protein [Demequinaceae bacterium]
MTQSGWRTVGGEEFSVRESVGGLRGLIESSAPGVVFVIAYLAWGGYKVPTIAACATVVLMVIARLILRERIIHALGGVFGVGLGALWAWRFGDPGEFFVPGFWINGATFVGLVLTILVGWPVVGVVVAIARGASMEWRRNTRLRRRFAVATWIMAGLFALKLAVQLPLYWADEVAVLGVAKLAMGVPLFVLTAWAIWLMVRGEELPGHSREG